MKPKKVIPTFDFYKTLDPRLRFAFSQLEDSYNSYDAALPHRHNYFEILLFKGTGGLHEIDFNAYEVVQNSLHFISPEQVHILRREKQVTGFVISFTIDFFLEHSMGIDFLEGLPFFNNPFANPVIKISDVSFQQKMDELIANIQTEFASNNVDKAEVLLSYLSILLITAKRIYVAENNLDKPLMVRNELAYKFKKLVDMHYRQHKTVSEFAQILHISAGHLNDTVQKDIGKTASEIIYARIILEAKRLLYHSPKSVKEIAADLLYDDPSYFTRFFKTHTQHTPEEFRKHIREKYQ